MLADHADAVRGGFLYLNTDVLIKQTTAATVLNNKLTD